MKKRHIFFYRLLRPLVILFLKLVFNYRYGRATNLPDNYMVLSNHTTDYDPLLVSAAFPRAMAFVGSEHVARWGFASRLLLFAFRLITRNKGASAAFAVKEMLHITRGGGNVCLFPEGVRSWDGVTCPILPSTAKLVKSAGCGLVTFRIEGGYFASPMWGGASRRRGRLYGAPVRVFTKEQLAAMSLSDIYEVIVTDLYEDAYVRQSADPHPYTGKRLAEKMETLLFICPACGKHNTIFSKDNRVACSNCGHAFTYTPTGMLEGGRFTTVKELSDWQKQQVAADIAAAAVYEAPFATLRTVQNHQTAPVATGPVRLDREQLVCGDATFSLESVSDVAMHGQRALVFTADGTYYELLPEDTNTLQFLLYINGLRACEKETVT